MNASLSMLAAALVACGASDHRFDGVWITDGTMAAQEPRVMKARQKDRHLLPEPDKSIENRHILFRRDFELTAEDVRRGVKAFVTADDYYKLYVNGAFVGQGPASGRVDYTYYNEIDLTPFVRSGRNVVAAHTYYQGLVNRVWVSGDSRHGFLLDVTSSGRTIVKSDESFRCAIHRGYSAMGTVGYKTQFMERYDAAAPEVGFASVGFDDSKWSAAVRNPHGSDYRVFPQPTPPVETELIRPAAFLPSTGGVVRADFGGVYVGSVEFAAHGGRGREIGILCGQELAADGSVRHKMRCNCDYVEKMVLSGGERDVLDQFDYKSFRYLELTVPEGAEVDRGSIALRARHLPFTLRARPNFGDDAELGRIWQLCVDTFRYGVQEQIQDCMDREKGYYLGDGVYTMYSYCLLTGDWAPARRFFDDFLRTSDIDAGLVTCANCSFMQEIAEYPLMFVLFARIYLEETGDTEFIRERYAKFAGILDCYRRRYARADGLLANLDKWCVVEWPKNFQDEYDADVRDHRICTDMHNVINAWYIGAVKSLNAVASRLGLGRYADAEPLERAFRKVFWNVRRGLFVDREGSTHVSLPGNCYAAFFGLMPREEKDRYHANYLALLGEKGYSSLSLFQFVPAFAYLSAHGERKMLREFILSPAAWKRMLREGATRTFEGWGRDTKWNTSLFHLTTASVVIFMCDSKLDRIVHY